MKYRLKIAHRTVEMAVAQEKDKPGVRITSENEIYDVHYERISDHRLKMRINGKPVQAFIAPAHTGKHVFLKGRTFLVQDADRLVSGRKRGEIPEEASREVTPPMPAVVVRILVKEGDPVKKGQGLVVVTAMKMETTLKAPKDGRVSRINTSVDAKVAPGDILVEIEEEVKEHE